MSFDFSAHKIILGDEDYPAKHNAFVDDIEAEFNNSLNFTNAAALAQAVIDTAADVVLTHADVVFTNADVVLTGLDVDSTNADVILTNADVVTIAATASGLAMFFDV